MSDSTCTPQEEMRISGRVGALLQGLHAVDVDDIMLMEGFEYALLAQCRAAGIDLGDRGHDLGCGVARVRLRVSGKVWAADSRHESSARARLLLRRQLLHLFTAAGQEALLSNRILGSGGIACVADDLQSSAHCLGGFCLAKSRKGWSAAEHFTRPAGNSVGACRWLLRKLRLRGLAASSSYSTA
jgi:hypothetical protein